MSAALPDQTISHRVIHIGKLLFPLFALALDLPESYFDDKVSHFSEALFAIELSWKHR